MLKLWLLINILMYALHQTAICGDTNQNGLLAISSNDAQHSSSEAEIPDLNIPLEGLFEEKTSNAHSVGDSAHIKKIKRLKKEGKYEELRVKERARMKRQYHSLTVAQKTAKSRKGTVQLHARMAKNPAAKEARKKSLRESYRRFRMRKAANKKGITIQPEDAKQKPGRRRVQISP